MAATNCAATAESITPPVNGDVVNVVDVVSVMFVHIVATSFIIQVLVVVLTVV